MVARSKGVPAAALSWGARAEPARLEQIGGLVMTACNVAIAVGAMVGGVLADGVGAAATLAVDGMAVIAGAVVLGSLRRAGTGREHSAAGSAPGT